MQPIAKATALAVSVFWIALAASAQTPTYPERPITVIVPFSAGGDADVAARNLAVVAQRVPVIYTTLYTRQIISLCNRKN